MASKFETLVVLLVLMATPLFALADDQSSEDRQFQQGPPKYICDANPDLCTNYWKSATDKNNGDVDPCKTELKDFKKAKNDFQTACGEAGITGDCVKAMAKCDPGASGSDNTESSDDDSKGASAERQFKKCPVLAGEDKDAFEKRMNDQRKKTDEMQKKIDDLESKANDKITATNEKLTEIKSQATDAAKKHQQDLKEATRAQQESEKAIMDQFYKLQSDISAGEDSLGQVDVSLREATVKLNATKAQIRLNCDASAMAEVSKLQDQVLGKLASNSYNRGGESAMFKNVGLTDRQEWQRIAQKYYNWCMDSQPTAESINGANDAYSVAVMQANKQKQSIRSKIQQMKDAELRLRDNNACGQTPMQANGSSLGNETALCTAAKQAMQDMQQLETAYRADVAQLNDKYNTLSQQGNREYQTLARQAQEQKTELDKERTRLTEMENEFALREKYSGGVNKDAKDVGKVFAAFSTLKTETGSLLECPKICPKNELATDSAKGSCEYALQFNHTVNPDDPDPQVDTSAEVVSTSDQTAPPAAPTPDKASRAPAQNSSDQGNMSSEHGKGVQESNDNNGLIGI